MNPNVTETDEPLFNRPMKLSTALLARGFLVDLVDEEIYLTDNACLSQSKYSYNWRCHDDWGFLTATLRRLRLGTLIRTGESARPFRLSQPEQVLNEQKLSSLFTYQHVPSRPLYPDGADDPDVFRERPYGLKIPIAGLDSHVALLVKALSAVGCFTHSSCDGYQLDGPYGSPASLYVSLAGEISTEWARYLINQAISAGANLPDLFIAEHEDYSGTITTEEDVAATRLACTRRQAIELALFIYNNRFLLRQQRIQWINDFRPQTGVINETSVSVPAREPIRFRVRLSDRTGFMVEFTVSGFRELEADCRAVFTSWLLINPYGKREREWPDQHQLDELEEDRLHIEDALTALLAPDSGEPEDPDEYIRLHRKSLMLRGHAEHLDRRRQRDLSPVLQIEITSPGQPARWRAPWGDCKPVRMRVVRTGANLHPDNWQFVFRRTALSGRKSTTDSWLLLWMGFREAFRD
ncbi:hypothetical protein [Stutzerimonas stutzeri]|uniref:hypothetical protein n=2 Tax=Stutzerimonas stutzeri subgroup TaxID=578833 RepID=UPI00371B0D96